jgi:hypothetical protein
MHLKSGILATIFLFLFTFAAFAQPVGTTGNDAGVAQIFIDTDDSSDVDDTYALSLANYLKSLGEVSILGVVTDDSSINSSAAAQATNTFYGNPLIPIGHCTGCVTANRPIVADAVASAWPSQLYRTTNTPENATTLYRKLLASRPDSSVTVVSIGLLRNIFNLYHSPADSISPLTGAQLISQKVKSIVAMGGEYGSGVTSATNPEAYYNFITDWEASQVINSLTTLPVVWVGYSLGKSVTGNVSGASHSPALTAARASGSMTRPAWDMLAMLYAIRGLSFGGETYFTLSTAGTNTVDANGHNTFTVGPGGKQHYLIAGENTMTLGNTISALVTSPTPQTNEKLESARAAFMDSVFKRFWFVWPMLGICKRLLEIAVGLTAIAALIRVIRRRRRGAK